MRLLISTPAMGGLVTTGFAQSLLISHARATAEGLVEAFDVHYQNSESLIHRARDRAADYFIRNDYDKLLTIDSDIEWSYEDFRRVITSDKDIIGGLYPLKAFPVVMNFNPQQDRGTELFKTHRGMDFDAFNEFCAKYADAEGIAEIRHLATGFMCVKRRVFEKLRETSKSYFNFDSVTGERKGFIHFYESGVHQGTLESEDWSFCRRAREAGFSVFVDTRIKLTHIGNHHYRFGQFFGQSQT